MNKQKVIKKKVKILNKYLIGLSNIMVGEDVMAVDTICFLD